MNKRYVANRTPVSTYRYVAGVFGMLRVLFLAPVLCFIAVSGTFNYLFSSTLGHGPVERWCWIALGIGAAAYSGLAFDIIRTNCQRGSPAKAFVAGLFLIVTLAWDARCAYGFTSMEAQRTKALADEAQRKWSSAEARVKAARVALEPYAI